MLASQDALSLLSVDERQYLQKYSLARLAKNRHNALLSQLYARAFTDSFPPHLQAFNNSRNEDIIETPDMGKAVFCRVIRTPNDGGDVSFPKWLQKYQF